MNNNIVEQIDALIGQLLKLLQKQYSILIDQGYGVQAINDILQNQIRTKNGIYIPLESVDYRIVYDYYENAAFKAFITLLSNIFSNLNSQFITFSFRTAMDLGFFIDILFSKEIIEGEKKHIKLVSFLTDLSPLSFQPYSGFFNKLLNTEFELLETKEQSFFKEISKLQQNNDAALNRQVNAARHLLSFKIGKLRKKVTPLPIFKNPESIYSVYSSQCHLLHGNPILVENVFDKARSSDEAKARILILLFGLNAAMRIATYLDNTEIQAEVKNLYENYQKLLPEYMRFCSKKYFQF